MAEKKMGGAREWMAPDGRAVTLTGNLSVEDIQFDCGVEEVDGEIVFCLEPTPDFVETFDGHVQPGSNTRRIDAYTSYDIATRQVRSEVQFSLTQKDGSWVEFNYPLTEAETEVLTQKMEKYCKQDTWRSLSQYSDKLLAEGLELPTEPVM